MALFEDSKYESFFERKLASTRISSWDTNQFVVKCKLKFQGSKKDLSSLYEKII